ncbi:MAG: hypothetical protein KJ626_05930 [Verrucomicrobia bacterium]|nr:hypothetical protein [Verrucomicrobiota bacterium]
MIKRTEEKRPVTPLILSATICPGLGQWYQGRRLAGALYIAAILITGSIFAVNAARGFVGWIADKWPFLAETTIPWLINVEGKTVLISFLAALAVYALNVVDVVLASHRTARG